MAEEAMQNQGSALNMRGPVRNRRWRWPDRGGINNEETRPLIAGGCTQKWQSARAAFAWQASAAFSRWFLSLVQTLLRGADAVLQPGGCRREVVEGGAFDD